MKKHNLTEAQQRYVRDVVIQSQELDRRLKWFLGYVIDESKLELVPNGWQLSQDGTSLVAPEPEMSDDGQA